MLFQNDDRTVPALMFLAACALLRLAFIATVPLLEAETYYWEWAQSPAWGYFDHPPMIAWLIGAATAAGGDSAFFIRLVPWVLSLATTGGAFLLARDLSGRRTALQVCCVLQVLPFFAASGVLCTPDAPLLCFLTLFQVLFHRAAVGSRFVLWPAAGAALGCALLSKYHAVLLLPCAGLYLWVAPGMRRWLGRPGPWVALAAALTVFLPNLLWNAGHGLRTVRFLLGERHGGLSFDPAGPLVFLAGFCVLLSPLVALGVLRVLPQLVRSARAGQDAPAFLLSMSLPIIVFFALLSPCVDVGAHWPAVGYLPLCLAALGVSGMMGVAGRGLRSPRFVRSATRLALGLTLSVFLVPMVLSLLPSSLSLGGRTLALLPQSAQSVFQAQRGTGAAIESLIETMPDPGRTFILTKPYRLASCYRLLTGSRYPTRVTGAKPPHQYQYWNAQGDLRGWDAVFIDKRDKEKYREQLFGLFERVGALEPLPVTVGGVTAQRLWCVRCFGFQGFAAEDGP